VAARVPIKLLVHLCPAKGGFAPMPDEPPDQRPGYERPPVDADGHSW